MVVGLLGNKSSDSNRFTLVTPKSLNDVRLQATLGNQNPTGLPVGAVRIILYRPLLEWNTEWHPGINDRMRISEKNMLWRN